MNEGESQWGARAHTHAHARLPLAALCNAKRLRIRSLDMARGLSEARTSQRHARLSMSMGFGWLEAGGRLLLLLVVAARAGQAGQADRPLQCSIFERMPLGSGDARSQARRPFIKCTCQAGSSALAPECSANLAARKLISAHSQLRACFLTCSLHFQVQTKNAKILASNKTRRTRERDRRRA